MTINHWIELIKIASPFGVVALGAYLAAKYYFNNKQVDYSLKLSEKVLEEVYTPIIVMIESQTSVIIGDGYEGLSFEELKKIDEIFKKHRHLINRNLSNKVWSLNEDYLNFLRDKRGSDEDIIVDRDGVFLSLLQEEYEFHINRIGFNFKNNKITQIKKME